MIIIAQSAAGRHQANADGGRTINTRANLECDRSAAVDRLLTLIANRDSMVRSNWDVNWHQLHNRALVLVGDRHDAIKRAIRSGLPVPPARNQFELIADEVCHLDQALAELKAEQNAKVVTLIECSIAEKVSSLSLFGRRVANLEVKITDRVALIKTK